MHSLTLFKSLNVFVCLFLLSVVWILEIREQRSSKILCKLKPYLCNWIGKYRIGIICKIVVRCQVLHIDISFDLVVTRKKLVKTVFPVARSTKKFWIEISNFFCVLYTVKDWLVYGLLNKKKLDLPQQTAIVHVSRLKSMLIGNPITCKKKIHFLNGVIKITIYAIYTYSNGGQIINLSLTFNFRSTESSISVVTGS